MPRRLAFTRLSFEQQPLVFLALAFISGLLFAARVSVSIHVWFTIAIGLWLLTSICVSAQRGGWMTIVALLAGCCACGGTLWALNEASVSESRVRRLFERGELSAAEPIEVWGSL